MQKSSAENGGRKLEVFLLFTQYHVFGAFENSNFQCLTKCVFVVCFYFVHLLHWNSAYFYYEANVSWLIVFIGNAVRNLFPKFGAEFWDTQLE